jgi:outer membrane lipoprotein LolB
MLEAPLPVAALFGWLKGMDAPAPGWRVDLCQVGKGRVQAVREWPQPTAKLNLVFEPAPAPTPATTPLNADVCANPN